MYFVLLDIVNKIIFKLESKYCPIEYNEDEPPESQTEDGPRVPHSHTKKGIGRLTTLNPSPTFFGRILMNL